MQQPRLHHVPVLRGRAVQRMAYWEWGDPANPRVLLCVHGVARQGRDFDTFALAMQDQYRVVCPDVLGRGHSDWLPDPAGYTLPAYAADMVTLIARLNVPEVHWVGTSMGGLIGMVVAALANSPVTRLVLNDVGPAIEADAVTRISAYLGQAVHWDTEQQAADALWAVSSGFGPHTPEQWLALTRPMLRPDGDGFKLHYDPSIAIAFRTLTSENAKAGEAVMWAIYDQIHVPTLVLRGAESDLLSRESAQAMTERGPKALVREFAGVGHAPMLTNDEQTGAVRTFLLGA